MTRQTPPAPHALPDTAPASMTSAPLPDAEAQRRQRRAIALMCLVSLIFALQDALSRHLASTYSTMFVVMIRYWVFLAFVTVVAARSPGGLGAVLRPRKPGLQLLRGLLLVGEIVVIIEAFVRLGLVASHAIFTAYPLLVVALSGPVLGERVGWRRWLAVAIGFCGILIILQPGYQVFSRWAALPLASAFMFALYGLLTRMAARHDTAQISFFWTALAGTVAITPLGLAQAEPMALADWPWMAGLCVTAISSHWLLIRAYEMSEASSLQPFAYTQLVWISLIGVTFLGERVGANVWIGAAIVVGAGLFTWWRAEQRARQAAARAGVRGEPRPPLRRPAGDP